MDAVAVLASGGLDSSVLLADLAQDNTVYPLYIRKGLAWEDREKAALEVFIERLASPNVRAVTVLSMPADLLYGEHWSLSGTGIPGTGTHDSAVFLPGRNVLLLALAAVWCSIHGVSDIAIGSLGDNPFPDATPEFFDAFAQALTGGLAHPIRVLAPYRGRGLHKADVIRRHAQVPLEATLTCMAPVDSVHCGACNKCEERQRAFTAAGVPDPTRYAT